MITEFTPYSSLLGGVLIGVAATLLMAFHGRVAGMTGILQGVLPPLSADWQWRAVFLAGAIAAPFVFVNLGGTVDFAVPVATLPLIAGGFVVGIGVYFGSGCTSGHGVCGMARLSPRSIVATLVFMAAAFVTVYVTRHVMGG
ncbi:YeeE/YedE family protein [Salaquimonas pukyongi]|uniref:YeeE/YedE family protein n=1 Tax=Salaquimonas pukyongi TaxID=2712698 RepID=UPI00096BBCA7|nr:YeeE/YedE thiosulfate transporter family protein [Salaquimonas pukyongi]